MQTIAIILAGTVNALLMVLQFAMLLRAIMSLFFDEGSSFAAFLVAITEPVIMPIRMLFDRMEWFKNSPLDVPFFVTYMLLAIISSLLSML